jgi:class 3 adenylate cyclase
LILLDKRGTGLSDRVWQGELPTLEERMDDVRAVLDAVGSERAVLFGTIGGAGICGLFAATHPERTLALVLYGALLKLSPDTGLLIRLADSVEAALDRIEQEWGTEGVGLAFWAPSLVGDETLKHAYMRLLRSGASPGTARTMMALGYEVDWTEVLPAVRVPTLVLHRTGDLVCPAHDGRTVAAGIEGARYVELPGTDHLVWAGDQDAVLREVEGFLATVGPARAHDRVLATIMFTDVVGSTQHAADLGDRRWRELLRSHQEVVRDQVAHFHGREIEAHGDEVLATFDGPARAIACARAAGEACEPLGIHLRAGLHTGEVELTDDAIRGIAVHVAARIVSLAEPDEILVSHTVRDLVAGSGIEFADRGLHSLKGVPGEWRLFGAIGERISRGR